jgi:hypothetical protein
MKTAKSLDGKRDHRLTRIEVRNVDINGGGGSPGLTYSLCSFRREICVAIGQDNVCAFAGEPLRSGQSNTPGCARHENDAFFESTAHGENTNVVGRISCTG